MGKNQRTPMPRRVRVLPTIHCQVSWVYADDGGGNTEFGDISRSYCSYAALSVKEQQTLKDFLKPWFDQGDIMDVYVGPVSDGVTTFLDEMAFIGQCLPDLDEPESR